MYLSGRAQELKLSNHHFPTTKAPAAVTICQCRDSVTLRLQRMNLCHQSMNDRTPRRKKNAKKNKKKENQTPQHLAHLQPHFLALHFISYPLLQIPFLRTVEARARAAPGYLPVMPSVNWGSNNPTMQGKCLWSKKEKGTKLEAFVFFCFKRINAIPFRFSFYTLYVRSLRVL